MLHLRLANICLGLSAFSVTFHFSQADLQQDGGIFSKYILHYNLLQFRT